MYNRREIARELDAIEGNLRELEILYEQYFAGVEKREPLRKREILSQRLRAFTNRRIIQTDLRFRYQTLAARFHSYAGYWDRILRLIDEGRYNRQAHRAALPPMDRPPPETENEVDIVYRALLEARLACHLEGPPPGRDQVARFLDQQKDRIREKFGDRDVEFRVVTEEGKPKIKVRAKK